MATPAGPLHTAARILHAGGVIAYPTEAVYGLGCDPANEQAVLRLLAIKQRPVAKGLILLAADTAQLRPWINVTDEELARMQASWPAEAETETGTAQKAPADAAATTSPPTTWVVPVSARVPAWVRGAHSTVAVRVSQHPLARALARQAGTPIISTSANLSGRPAARNAFQVARQLGDQLDMIVSGECNIARRPSVIIDLASGRQLRS
ncbi:L-threonylcarbamoyladenylate synthase [Alcanivorax sp. JB21]|uniref:L-threonylcarbamoyladenylate synthase n=1 Tax=Alcanivorax limicola TaxID=2874102 RepID=UPI001CBFEBAC|nr:L-threonylcarbamoyladenylate synthase [Alcanivorax limicola]MBZ2189024.1 L-threonylcarbamoyladenylate synthase [Alcanivorax limicola]